MLAKRIIACLDIKDGRTVEGVNFLELRDAGDPVNLAKYMRYKGPDELVFLDIVVTHEKRKTLVILARAVAKNLNIPLLSEVVSLLWQMPPCYWKQVPTRYPSILQLEILNS